jgi:hypothetical protein
LFGLEGTVDIVLLLEAVTDPVLKLRRERYRRAGAAPSNSSSASTSARGLVEVAELIGDVRRALVVGVVWRWGRRLRLLGPPERRWQSARL